MMPTASVIELELRAGDYCEACGVIMPLGRGHRAIHHRKLRSHGGGHEPVNLMLVHPLCHNLHTNSIHMRIIRSRRLFHIVDSWDDPARTTPIVLPGLLRVVA